MSLLFDALKRAQGNKPDASAHAQSQAPAGNKIKILPYAVASLVLLAGGLSWFGYQENKYIPTATEQTAMPARPQPLAASAPLAASQPAAAMTQTDTPATTSKASAKKAWAHPIAKKATRTKTRKPAKPGILVSTDPLKEAYLALSQGHLDLAEQRYLAVLARRPHEKDALLGLAVIAQRRLQTDRAASLYRQVLHEDMGNAAAAAGLISLSMQADPVAAESQLRELLDIKPAAPELHYALGGVLAQQIRWGEAQQSFYRAYSLAPDNSLYAYNLAVTLDHLHQPAAALSYYEKASRLSNPDDTTLDLDAIRRRIQELSRK
jgi:tetratricopeptide (TPR) repeat protein